MRFGLDCYHFSATLPSEPLTQQTLPEHTIFHMYWRADLSPFRERQALVLKSLFTSQDCSRTSAILWTNNESLLHNPLLLQIQEAAGKERLSIRIADFGALARGTPMEGHPLISSSSSDRSASKSNSKSKSQSPPPKRNDKKGWLDGDLLRILVLYSYGGVWVDMDSVILRSFRPLLEAEWVTQWDCYDKPYAPLNGAVMAFYRHSPYLCEMMYAMATSADPPRSQSTDWGSRLYHQVHRRLLQAHTVPFAVLPHCLMDSRSCRLDNRLPDPFERDDPWISTPKGLEELRFKVDSIFSIHLHNQWDRDFPKGGWMERLVVHPIQADWIRLVEESKRGTGTPTEAH